MRNVFQKILAAITTPAQLPVGENQEAAMPTLETIDSDTKTNSSTENKMFAKIKAMFKKETVMEKEITEINVENPVEDEMDLEIEIAEPVQVETCPPPAKVAAYNAGRNTAAVNEECAVLSDTADVLPPVCGIPVSEGVAEGCTYKIFDKAAKRHIVKCLNRDIAHANWQVHLARLGAFRGRSPKAGSCKGGNALHRRRKAHKGTKTAVKAAAKARRADRIKAAAFEAARVRLERFFAALATAFLGTLKPAFREIFRVNRTLRRQQRAAEKRAARLAAVKAAHEKWVAENPAALATQTPEAKAARLAVEAKRAAVLAEQEARKNAWLDRQAKKKEKTSSTPRLSAEEARAAKSARKAAEKKAAAKPAVKPVVKGKKGTATVSFVEPAAKPAAKKAWVTVTQVEKKAAAKPAAKPAVKPAPVAKTGRPERVIPGNNLPKGLRKKAAAMFAPDPVPANPKTVTAIPTPAPAPAPVAKTAKLTTEEAADALVAQFNIAPAPRRFVATASSKPAKAATLLPNGVKSIQDLLQPWDSNLNTMSDLLTACLIYGVKSGLKFYHHSGCAELELNSNETENNGGNQ